MSKKSFRLDKKIVAMADMVCGPLVLPVDEPCKASEQVEIAVGHCDL